MNLPHTGSCNLNQSEMDPVFIQGLSTPYTTQHPTSFLSSNSHLDSTANLSHRLLYGVLSFTWLSLCLLYLASWPIIFWPAGTKAELRVNRLHQQQGAASHSPSDCELRNRTRILVLVVPVSNSSPVSCKRLPLCKHRP